MKKKCFVKFNLLTVMKKTTIIYSIIFVFLGTILLYSQNIKLKNYFDQNKVKDYKERVQENTIYPEDMKFIVHSFELSEGKSKTSLDKGTIYRQFYKNGRYETFYAVSDKKMYRVSYWSDPTALITANINKSEYCVEKNINNILFPMVLRGYAKILKKGSYEKKFKNITFIIKKLSEKKENGNLFVTFQVSSSPSVIDGTIEAYKGSIVLRGNLTIDNDLAKRSGLKLIFSHDDLPKTSIINLKFDYNYMENKKPSVFMEQGLDEIIKKFEKIECD